MRCNKPAIFLFHIEKVIGNINCRFHMTADELQKRLRSFAYRIVSLCEALPLKKISGIIEAQLLKSAFSAAAN